VRGFVGDVFQEIDRLAATGDRGGFGLTPIA
jgi:hypothetical protein